MVVIICGKYGNNRSRTENGHDFQSQGRMKKSRFWLKFSKISILLEIVDFPRNIRKFTILVEIFENLDFGRSSRFSSKY